MARLSLRDRFFTPPVARAVTSPGAILLAGAGAAVGIVAGLPIAAAAAVGVAAWGVRVAVAVPRNASAERIDPFALQDPWRTFVREAVQARGQFEAAVRQCRAGPLRERLGEISDRVATGVDESWRVARAGQALSDARSSIDVRDITYQLQQVQASSSAPPSPDSPAAQTIAALEAQLATAARMDRVVADTRDRLRLLDAQLDEAVTRAIELSVRAEQPEDLGGLRDDVESLVGELESLRQGLAEADGPGVDGTDALPPPPPSDSAP